MLCAVAELIQVEGVNFVLCHKAKSSLQGFRHSIASVKDTIAESDVRQEFTAVVDLLDGKDHCLQPTETTEVIPVNQSIEITLENKEILRKYK